MTLAHLEALLLEKLANAEGDILDVARRTHTLGAGFGSINLMMTKQDILHFGLKG